ncbi:amidase domain-containing protein [Pullulanibacillus camelliae]|nr:amidase domain-containing protein [Pullulanibacillus camelliae]
MAWQNELKLHLQKLSDFWVERNLDRYQLMEDQEKKAIHRKKAGLRERGVDILKAEVSGNILGTTVHGSERTVDYFYRLRLFQKQQDTFFFEDVQTKRRATFKEGELIKDSSRAVESSVMDVQDVPTKLPQDEWRMPGKGKGKGKGIIYDRLAAVKYADRWWDAYNPKFRAFDVDCTNYVSQCVFAGGGPMNGQYNKHSGWWYEGNRWSLSWAVAHSFRWYLASEGNRLGAVAVEHPEQLQPGDVICYDFEGDGHWDHSTIVTEKDGKGMPLVNAHTTNSRHRYWAYEDSTAWTQNIKYKFYHFND